MFEFGHSSTLRNTNNQIRAFSRAEERFLRQALLHVEVVSPRSLVAWISDVVQSGRQLFKVDQTVLVDVEGNVLGAKIQNLLLVPPERDR